MYANLSIINPIVNFSYFERQVINDKWQFFKRTAKKDVINSSNSVTKKDIATGNLHCLIMITRSIESIHQFISANNLKRIDGNILFDAEVNFYSGDTLRTIISQVQLIILSNEIAVYILEFLEEEYKIKEMYNTGQYYFSCTESKTLEIFQSNKDDKFYISITPLQ